MTSKSAFSIDKKSATILFVDDEPLSLKYFKATVGKYANVKTASSPDAAMEILEQEGDEISVVVSDERMPRDSGVSFLSDVRKSYPSTVRVLTSAYADIDNLQHAINDAAIFRFVPKPWNLDELCAAMQDALHVERSAAALSEQVLGPSQSAGDAQEANLALLSVLANGLESPLQSLNAEALQLSLISGPSPLNVPKDGTSHLESWSSRMRLSMISAASRQIVKDVDECRSLTSSIGKLARGLVSPMSAQSSSMADTLLEVIEQNLSGPIQGLSLDTSRDFTYTMPREIMKFVIGNLLRGGGVKSRRPKALVWSEIVLVSGPVHNEIRLRLAPDQSPLSLEDNHSWRTIRSALWAFGGELAMSSDEKTGNPGVILRLPKAS